MTTKCIDVSEHQGKINWKKVKKAGVEVAIIRAGYGKNNTDAHWKDNIEGAIKAGIPHIGVYWFSYAYSLTMAVNEANYCYKHIEPYKDHIDFGVWFDWEYSSMAYAVKMKANTSKQRITDMHKAFCERIKALGHDGTVIVPGFYYNWDYKKNHIDLNQLPYLNWYALDDSNGKFKSVAIQQWGVSTVPGIKGKVDSNWVFTDVSKVKPSTDGIPAIPARGYFKKGDKGDAVKWIQKKLNAKLKISDTKAAAELGLKIKVTGVFDDATVKALKIFQDVRHIKIDGKAGVVSLTKLDKCKITKEWMEVNFLVAVARDDSFAYGEGERAHHNGCYFCGTNITGKKKAKKGSKWEKTYCCNPFIHAGGAHGAGYPGMLEECKKNSQAGLRKTSWTGRGFKAYKLKDFKYEDLKTGDKLLREDSHICEFTGAGWIVEASGEGWGSSTIAHKKSAKKRFNDYAKSINTYVIRRK